MQYLDVLVEPVVLSCKPQSCLSDITGGQTTSHKIVHFTMLEAINMYDHFLNTP